MKKILKLCLKTFGTIILFILVVGFVSAITKNIYARILINNFKSKGVLQQELSTEKVKIYHIETNETISSTTMKEETKTPGNVGDIVLSLESQIDFKPIAAVISFFAGGHAGVILDDYIDYEGSADVFHTLESTGLGLSTDAFVFNKNYWYEDGVTPYDEMIVLRVKDTTEEDRKKVVSKAMSLVNEPYNFTFFFNTKNASYCSDIVGKSYAEVGVDLNKDKLTTSVYDLLLSGETYISYYFCIDNEGIKHIYYVV